MGFFCFKVNKLEESLPSKEAYQDFCCGISSDSLPVSVHSAMAACFLYDLGPSETL